MAIDGRLVGIEVKLTTAPGDADVRHLLWLRETVPERVADLVILTTGRHAYCLSAPGRGGRRPSGTSGTLKPGPRIRRPEE